MFTSTTLFLPESNAALTVSAKAAFVENGRTFAYVQTGALQFARREIEATTMTGSGRLRIARGLTAGDRVVSDGVLLLRQLEIDSPSNAPDR